MARLVDVVKAGKGVAGAWSVSRHDDCAMLYHYSTRMLRWKIDDPTDEDVLDFDLGWGSVSDQQGMNKAFAALGLPYYYKRAGGASIEKLDAPQYRWGITPKHLWPSTV